MTATNDVRPRVACRALVFALLALAGSAAQAVTRPADGSTVTPNAAAFVADVHAILGGSPDPAYPGFTIDYTIGVGNNGPNGAANASFSMATPNDTVFESLATSGSWSCTTPAAGTAGTVTCTQAALLAGTADLLTLVVRVAGNPAAGTQINASVSIASSTIDPVPTNNAASSAITVGNVWTLDLQDVLATYDDNDATGDASPGDLMHYDITATNTGNAPLTNVFLSDDRFPGTQTCASVPAGGTCVLSGTDLLDNNDVPQVDNTATATATELGAPMQATTTTPVVFHPFPAMTATYTLASYDDADGNSQVTQGDTLHVLVTATNTGNTTLTNLQIDDPDLVPTFTVCSGVSPGGTCQLVATTAVTQGDAILGSVDRIANVASTELPSWGTVAFSTPATATPAVVIDNVLTGSVDVDNSGSISPGDELDYDITATNTGSLTLTSVMVSSDITGATQACPAVAPNGTCVLSAAYVVALADASAGSVTNTASVTSTELPAGATDAEVTAVTAPPVLNIVSGDNSAGYGGQHATLVVSLRDVLGNPMTGETITWTGADQATSLVQADGTSTNTVSFNGTTGQLSVFADYLPAQLQVQFSVQSISAALFVSSGNNQDVPAGTQAPIPLEVLATDDGAPISTGIVWTVTGDASVTPTANGTDIDGLASTVLTVGPTQGPVQVQAKRPDSGETAVFSINAVAPVRTLLIHAGNSQSGPPGAVLPLNLVVEARDNGVGVDNKVINFTVIGGSDAQVGTCCGTTAGGGFAGTSLTLRTTPGPVQVRAERQDDPSVFVVFDATALARGLVYVSGNNQSAPAGAALPALLSVQSQLGGVAEPGVALAWTTTAANATVVPVTDPTDGSGTGTAQVTCGASGESFTVTAARSDNPTVSVTFTASCTLVRTLVIASGNNQSGAPGAVLPLDLVVEAKDNGVAVDGKTIDFSIVGGSDAAVAPASLATAGGGFAGTSLTLRSSAGPVQVRAQRADDPTVFVLFDASALARGLAYVSGNNQSAPTGAALPALLAVQTQLGGVAEPGVALTWTTNATNATVAPVIDPTDGAGNGTARVTCGATAETFDVVAARVDNPTISLTFTATCTLVRTLAITAGNNGTATTTSPFPQLSVQAKDNGAAVAGVVIDWVASGNASVVIGSSVTDASGTAVNASVIAGAPGAATVTATRNDDPTATVTFDLTSIAAPTLTVTSGDAQAGLVGTAADAPLVVTLLDASGNPMPNQAIAWSTGGEPGVLSTTSSTTDSFGRAQADFTFGATAATTHVTATFAGPTLPAVFTLTAVNGVIGPASGNNQTGPIDSLLPLPLTVQVALPAAPAKHGVRAQALDGVPVTFTVATGGGGVNPQVVLTDASGRASTQFTLGPTVGAQTVTASIPGGASTTFTATATLTRTLVIVSGDGQAAAPGAVLPAPLVVHAQDNGADAGAIGITWTVPGGTAAVVPSGPTDAAGFANATVTLGATPGAVTIRAARADDATVYVDFSINTAQIQDLVGLTPEELDLAKVIDQTCATLAGMASLTPEQQDFLARCQELSGGVIIDPGAVVDALDQLIPGLAMAMEEAAFNAAQAQFQNLKARIAALRSGTQGSSFQGLALNNSSGTVSLGSLGAALVEDAGDADAKPRGDAGAGFQRWGFFATGTIGRAEAEAGSTRPAYDYDINGLTVGLDYRYSDTFIFGGALGYTRQDGELRDQPGQMDMSGWSVSGYATWYRDNSWYTDAVLTWGRNNFDLLRTITYTVPLPGGGSSSIAQSARSNSDGDMLEGAFTFGHDFQAGGWSIGPYGRLLYTKLEFDRIVDEMDAGPGSGLGLSIDARTLTSLSSELGAKFTYAHSTDWGVVTPHLQLEWEHEFKDDPQAMTARFLADPAHAPFSLAGEDVDKDYFRLSVGLSVILQHGRSGFVLYERTVGREGFSQDNLGFGVRIEF